MRYLYCIRMLAISYHLGDPQTDEPPMAAYARALRALRGRRIGWVLQDPRYSLNPVMRIGAQIEEGLRHHQKLTQYY